MRRNALFVHSQKWTYTITDDWLMSAQPADFPERPENRPVGQHTEFTGTVVPRAYDWLVFQYPLLDTPIVIQTPNTTKQRVIPNLNFNNLRSYAIRG